MPHNVSPRGQEEEPVCHRHNGNKKVRLVTFPGGKWIAQKQVLSAQRGKRHFIQKSSGTKAHLKVISNSNQKRPWGTKPLDRALGGQ